MLDLPVLPGIYHPSHTTGRASLGAGPVSFRARHLDVAQYDANVLALQKVSYIRMAIPPPPAARWHPEEIGNAHRRPKEFSPVHEACSTEGGNGDRYFL